MDHFGLGTESGSEYEEEGRVDRDEDPRDI